MARPATPRGNVFAADTTRDSRFVTIHSAAICGGRPPRAKNRIARFWAFALTLAFILGTHGVALAQSSPSEAQSVDKQVAAIRADLRKAGRLFQQKKLQACVVLLGTVQEDLDRLQAAAPVPPEAEALVLTLQRAKQALKKHGFSLETAAASPKTAVEFSTQIAPLFANCARCHGAERARSGLNITSFRSLLAGSRNGPVIVVGKPDDSLLIGKLKGTASGERMPMRETPLTDQQIELVETWIREGAKFDAADPGLNLGRVVAMGRLSKLGRDGVNAELIETAEKNWGMAFPNRPVAMLPAGPLLLVGPTEDQLLSMKPKLEKAYSNANKQLKLSKERRLPVTAYVLPKQYDYAEFIAMIEKRQVSPRQTSHWRADASFGYIAIGPQAQDDDQVDRQLVAHTASLLASGLGAPLWFAEGLGAETRGKVYPRRRKDRGWPAQAADVVRRIKDADQLLSDGLSVVDADTANRAFVQFLASDQRRMTRLLLRLDQGEAFADAFRAAYGDDMEVVCRAWLDRYQSAAKRNRNQR